MLITLRPFSTVMPRSHIFASSYTKSNRTGAVVAPVDAENWISHMEKIFDVMDCNDTFKTRLAVYKFEGDALAWWKAYKQAKEETVWVADAARNLEILRARTYDRSERSDKRHKSGDRYQPDTQQNNYRSHDQKNDRQDLDRQRRRFPAVQYPLVILTLFAPHVGRRHPGECRRAAGTCFKCGQAGHLQRDCKKNTGASFCLVSRQEPTHQAVLCTLLRIKPPILQHTVTPIDCIPTCYIGDNQTPEFINHGSLPGKSMKIISL
ncbi:putative reverse transcriptase domain-containing protein [Tanacetum coccineum]